MLALLPVRQPGIYVCGGVETWGRNHVSWMSVLSGTNSETHFVFDRDQIRDLEGRLQKALTSSASNQEPQVRPFILTRTSMPIASILMCAIMYHRIAMAPSHQQCPDSPSHRIHHHINNNEAI